MRDALFVLCFLCAGLARAQGEIVYAARYYAPPSQPKRKSFQHIYRINADGSGRRQITFGENEDDEPNWSPDGRQIAFFRSPVAQPYEKSALCVMDADGKNLRVLSNVGYEWIPGTNLLLTSAENNGKNVLKIVTTRRVVQKAFADTHFRGFSPDGTEMILETQGKLRRVNWKTGASVDFPTRYGRIAFLRGGLMASYQDEKELQKNNFMQTDLCFLNFRGEETRRVRVGVKDADNNGFVSALRPMPNTDLEILMGFDAGNSTDGHWIDWHRVDTKAGKTQPFTAGLTLSFSPDGKRFVTMPHRELMPYGKNKNGEGQIIQLDTAPLLVGLTGTGKTGVIVSGLVYVQSADWRPR